MPYEMKKPIETIYSKVAGTTFYNVDWDAIGKGDFLEAVREPSNPYDSNAIKLLHNGKQIGHIKKELAAELAPMMDNKLAGVLVEVQEITGIAQLGLFSPPTQPKSHKNRGINLSITITYQQEYLNSFIDKG